MRAGPGPKSGGPEGLERRFDEVAPARPAAYGKGLDAHLVAVELAADVFVAGGGMAGVCAALAAARHGAKVVLVQDRSRLGGNSSSEVKMHIVGADCGSGARPGWREGGLIEEALRLDDAVGNPQRSREMWDLLLYDKLVSEPNVTLLLDTACVAAEVRDGRVESVVAFGQDGTRLPESGRGSTWIARGTVGWDWRRGRSCGGDGRRSRSSGRVWRWSRRTTRPWAARSCLRRGISGGR